MGDPEIFFNDLSNKYTLSENITEFELRKLVIEVAEKASENGRYDGSLVEGLFPKLEEKLGSKYRDFRNAYLVKDQ